MILNSEFWTLNVDAIYLPKVLEKSIQQFSNFFSSFNSKKVLKFALSKSNCEIEGKFDKIYSFNFNTVQVVVLMAFNDFRYRDVSLKEIMTKIGITQEKDLLTNLSSLLNNNLILKKAQNTFALNKDFTNNSIKVKSAEITNDEKFIRKEKIEDDRSAAIEATIVRVMKSHKRLSHNELIKKVMDQMEHFKIQILVRFKFNFRLLKRKSIIYLKEN